MRVLAFDTSNYTTSVASFDGTAGHNISRLLDVEQGALGLRQSDALFAHVKRLPELADRLFSDIGTDAGFEAVGVSTRPRAVEGSYMPCFLAGESQARVLGAALGVIPQCGFSAATANLYAGGIITRGTLLAVFLSTSDEMLPILLSSSAPVPLILKLLGYKALAGILLGVAVDTVASKLGYERKKSIHEMCEQEHCHCEDGIFKSALRHTLKIFAFLFVVTFVLNLLVEAVGPETLGAFVLNRPVIGELLGGIIGFIPNCAASVVLTTLYLEGAMSGGAMLSGLLVGSGVGLLVLLRMNRDWRDNLVTAGLLYAGGVIFGLLADVLHIV